MGDYIKQNKDRLTDPRNWSMVKVKDDPMGRSFGCDNFHRSQVDRLIQSRLKTVSDSPEESLNSERKRYKSNDDEEKEVIISL